MGFAEKWMNIWSKMILMFFFLHKKKFTITATSTITIKITRTKHLKKKDLFLLFVFFWVKLFQNLHFCARQLRRLEEAMNCSEYSVPFEKCSFTSFSNQKFCTMFSNVNQLGFNGTENYSLFSLEQHEFSVNQTEHIKWLPENVLNALTSWNGLAT